ncbi:transketolase family protein [Candidatus Woesearchaeota archaeon]|nr:transketolase family protein [Candidatus Woesearchaeota archaeon]
MINPNLFNNPEKKSTRDGFGHALVELGSENPNIIVLSADLAGSTRADWFQKKHPNRFIQVGVSEQDLLGESAGLSLVGKIPFATTFSIFSSGRAWDQLRNTICYPGLNVKIGATHSGISVGEDGASHQATEDIAIVRVIPNITLIVPCDYYEAKKATKAAAKINGPVYLRLGRSNQPIVSSENSPFKPGEINVLKTGKDVSIIACGIMVYEALVAAKQLENEDISAAVLNCHTIKPLDKKKIIQFAKATGAIVSAEEHQISGGLGSAVAEVVSQNQPVPMEIIGLRDRFGQSGKTEELFIEYGLTAKNIISAVHKVIKRKR